LTKEQWCKIALNEELIEQYQITLNELSKKQMFGVSYMECKKELDMIKAEMLKRMK
jgi:hypothetical protein